MSNDNLDLLAIILYGGLATPTQWLGGPNAQILKDAANAITSLTQQLAEANARIADVEQMLVEKNKCYVTAFNSLQVVRSVLAEANARVEGKWISVSERLPEDGEAVLTWENDGTMGCAYINYIPFRSAVGIAHTHNVGRFNSAHDYITHWQPLPIPPKGEVNDKQ